jgi:hypothetical protein
MTEARLRAELVEYVNQLADPSFPSRAWRSSRVHPAPGVGWPNYVDYFVYDNPFASAPDYNVGLRLRSLEEANAVAKLAIALEQLVRKVGYYAEPAIVLSRPEWQNLVVMAQSAKEKLSG